MAEPLSRRHLQMNQTRKRQIHLGDLGEVDLLTEAGELYARQIGEDLDRLERDEADARDVGQSVDERAKPRVVVHDLVGRALGLELLETQEIDLAASDQAVSELVQLGVKIHLDDLSSGFSTLKRITELPFDVIKIDRRFFDQLTSRPLQVLTLLAAITKLGEDFGYGVVVEGVEDMERLEISAVLGAGAGQGYLFAAPMPPEKIRDWVLDFRSPYQPGVLTTTLGALAYHWTHTSGNGPEHPAYDDCPLTPFFVGSAEESLHDAVHAKDPVAGQELTDALLSRVTAAGSSTPAGGPN